MFFICPCFSLLACLSPYLYNPKNRHEVVVIGLLQMIHGKNNSSESLR